MLCICIGTRLRNFFLSYYTKYLYVSHKKAKSGWYFLESVLRIYEGSGDDNLATLAVFAQEESLEQQLQYGVRGLDIRVGYCKSFKNS